MVPCLDPSDSTLEFWATPRCNIKDGKTVLLYKTKNLQSFGINLQLICFFSNPSHTMYCTPLATPHSTSPSTPTIKSHSYSHVARISHPPRAIPFHMLRTHLPWFVIPTPRMRRPHSWTSVGRHWRSTRRIASRCRGCW